MEQSAKWKRVEAAIAGEPADRVPFAFWMHFPGIDGNPDELVEATLSQQRRYDMDFIKVMFRSTWCVEDWGVWAELFHPTRGSWIISHYPVQSPQDWYKLKPLDPTQGALGEQLYILRKLKETVQGDAPILATVFSPTMVAAHLINKPTFIKHLREEPEAVKAGLEVITQTVINFGQACLDNGADGIFYAIQAANRHVMKEEEYRPFGQAYDRPALERLHARSRFTMLHMHGDDLFFDELASYPAHVLNWYDRSRNLTIEEARQRTGKCLAGGIDHERTLMLGTLGEISAEVRDALSQGKGGGFMLAPGCGVPITVHPESLSGLVEILHSDF